MCSCRLTNVCVWWFDVFMSSHECVCDDLMCSCRLANVCVCVMIWCVHVCRRTRTLRGSWSPIQAMVATWPITRGPRPWQILRSSHTHWSTWCSPCCGAFQLRPFLFLAWLPLSIFFLSFSFFFPSFSFYSLSSSLFYFFRWRHSHMWSIVIERPWWSAGAHSIVWHLQVKGCFSRYQAKGSTHTPLFHSNHTARIHPEQKLTSCFSSLLDALHGHFI